MKIGQFALQNHLSIEAIRHYMDLGLIIPEKKGGHYSFDERCQKDLEDILSFKSMGFTLIEIKSIFMFKRLGKLTPYQEEDYYREFFLNKYENTVKQIETLTETKTKIESKLAELSSKESKKNFKMGVHLNTLNQLQCLECKEDLVLVDGQITNHQIINGKLQCKCGEEYLIKDGILYGRNLPVFNENRFENNYIHEYINETNPEYLDNISKGLEWVYKKLPFDQLKNKVILDLGSGIGFLLRQIYHDLPQDMVYIAVDYDIRRHLFLKNILEKAEVQKNILFICTDFLSIPIKDRSVDVILDHAGTSNYSFEHEDFLLKLIDHYVKEEAVLFAGFILFDRFGANSLIEEQYRKNFQIDHVKNELAQLQYKSIDDRRSRPLGYAGKYENYFTKDERVYNYLFYGKR